MIACCYLAVGWAWGIVMLFPACFCVVVVAPAVVAEYSFPAFTSHVALFFTSEACWSVSEVGVVLLAVSL